MIGCLGKKSFQADPRSLFLPFFPRFVSDLNKLREKTWRYKYKLYIQLYIDSVPIPGSISRLSRFHFTFEIEEEKHQFHSIVSAHSYPPSPRPSEGFWAQNQKESNTFRLTFSISPRTFSQPHFSLTLDFDRSQSFEQSSGSITPQSTSGPLL